MIDLRPATEPAGLRARAALRADERAEMFALLARHFEGVTRAQFDRDLDAKNWVIALRREGRLVGFTTLLVRNSTDAGETITAIYSGDTIVAPEAWGTPALARAWIAGVNRLRNDFPAQRCFWLLLTSGFRTYRFLPVFWREFFPCVSTTTPPARQHLLERLAREGYGASFDPRDGIVRFPRPQRLRGRLAPVPDGRDANPHIAFFLSRNPGHARGDEIACLTEICEANLTAAGRRMVAPVEA
jgi:hypothetical protein